MTNLDAQLAWAKAYNAVATSSAAAGRLKPIDLSIFEDLAPSPDEFAEMDSTTLRGGVTEAVAPDASQSPFWSAPTSTETLVEVIAEDPRRLGTKPLRDAVARSISVTGGKSPFWKGR
jgi:hypothetical protein